MARNLYGATPADVTTTRAGQIIPGATLAVYDDPDAGTQVTDLLDYNGNVTTVAVSDADGLVRFYGPDGEDGPLWLDGGAGSTRLLIRPVDLPPVTADGVDTVHLKDGAVTDTKLANNSVTSAKIVDGTIVNADISASAAIDRSKIAGAAITAADTGTVTNAMLAGSIARSKISGLPTSSTDNTLPRFDSTGGALQTSGIVVDDNDRIRVASGSVGGVEIGSGGPRMMMGSGTPSGVSAPVGSTWRQTDANSSHGSLTGLLWNKVGTGTAEGTDWLVDYEGRWVSYTVAVTGWTKGSGTVTGYYTRSGRWVSWHCTFALNSTTVSGSLTLSLPVTPAAYTAGEGVLVDSGTGTYLALVRLLDTGLAYVSAIGTNGAFLSPTSTVPFTWANGDSVIASATYRI